MIFHDPLHNVLMCSITEGSIGTHLAIAKLVVTRFRDVECHWAESGDYPLALAITEGTNLGMTARAPVVRFTSMQINVSRE